MLVSIIAKQPKKENKDFLQWQEERVLLSKNKSVSLVDELKKVSEKKWRFISRDERIRSIALMKLNTGQLCWKSVNRKEEKVGGKECHGVRVFDNNESKFIVIFTDRSTIDKVQVDLNLAKIMYNNLTDPQFLVRPEIKIQ